MQFKKLIYSLLCASIFVPVACAQSNSNSATKKYGYGLPATGSDQLANTIFTNPGQDCSTQMNTCWVSPIGTECEIELINENTGHRSILRPHKPRRCDTYNNIYSILSNGKNVTEKHVFDKYSYDFSNLHPDTYYSYRILSLNPETGERDSSDYYIFRTAGHAPWKAAVIGDFHHYSPLWSRLEAAMDMLEVIKKECGEFDWVLSTGDMLSWGASFNFWTELSEQPMYMDNMWAAVQGNHDHQDRNNGKSDAYFRDAQNYPRNGYAGQEGVVYWFKYGDVLFMMLNNEAMRKAGSLQPALDWMKKVVAENPTKYRVVVEHSEWLIGTDGKSSNLDRFRKTFDELGIDLALSGNNHAYIRTYPLRDRQPVEPEDGTYYVVTPSSDNSRGRALNPLVENKDIVAHRWSEGTKTVGAMLMDVNSERIEMTLYDRYGKVQDSFIVPAKR